MTQNSSIYRILNQIIKQRGFTKIVKHLCSGPLSKFELCSQLRHVGANDKVYAVTGFVDPAMDDGEHAFYFQL